MTPRHYWQYNGVAPMIEILHWCHTTIPGEFSYRGWDVIEFYTDRARTLFALRWP